MKIYIVGLSLLMVLLLSAVSRAEEKADKAVEAGITIEQAIEIAKKEIPGSVIEAEYEAEKGVYEVKIKTEDGERIKLKIDAKDGSIKRKGRILKGASPKGSSK